MHVGMYDRETGEVLYHEIIEDVARARMRYTMFSLTAELDCRDRKSFTEAPYAGAEWPPPGWEESEDKSHLRPVAVAETAPTEAHEEE